jgi:hypothetical protein
VWRLSLFVGYGQSTLKKNGSLVAAQFINIGASKDMPLQSLVPTGENTSDNVQIQTLDAYGYTVDSYDWNDWAADKPCWVDGDYAPIENVSFAPGQALWVMASDASQGLQSAGQVNKEDVKVFLKKNGTLVGNPFPVELDLQDILAGGDSASDNVQIQTLDAYGYTVDSYDWNDWAADKPCWVDGDYNPVENVTIAPGQGLWVMGSSAEQYLLFPAPEL